MRYFHCLIENFSPHTPLLSLWRGYSFQTTDGCFAASSQPSHPASHPASHLFLSDPASGAGASNAQPWLDLQLTIEEKMPGVRVAMLAVVRSDGVRVTVLAVVRVQGRSCHEFMLGRSCISCCNLYVKCYNL